MAYGFTYTAERVGKGYLYTINESELGTTDEWGPIFVPVEGRIVRLDVEKVSGSGTAFTPILGKTSGFTADTNDQVAVAAQDAHPSEVLSVPYTSPTRELYGRTTPDAGSDNVVETLLLIVPDAV